MRNAYEKTTIYDTIKKSNYKAGEKIENYDPFNEHAKDNGMVTEWVARNKCGIAVAFGYTKAECIADAGRYCKLKQDGS